MIKIISLAIVCVLLTGCAKTVLLKNSEGDIVKCEIDTETAMMIGPLSLKLYRSAFPHGRKTDIRKLALE